MKRICVFLQIKHWSSSDILDQQITQGVQEKYDVVVKARKEAEKLGTIEAQRERVEAELIFEKYINELSTQAGYSSR